MAPGNEIYNRLPKNLYKFAHCNISGSHLKPWMHNLKAVVVETADSLPVPRKAGEPTSAPTVIMIDNLNRYGGGLILSRRIPRCLGEGISGSQPAATGKMTCAASQRWPYKEDVPWVDVVCHGTCNEGANECSGHVQSPYIRDKVASAFWFADHHPSVLAFAKQVNIGQLQMTNQKGKCSYRCHGTDSHGRRKIEDRLGL